jgi:hypothetical protein
MNADEMRLEIIRLTVRQEQIERAALEIDNRGCLSPEEAKKKMKAERIKTEICRDGTEAVIITAPDGEKGYTGFPA